MIILALIASLSLVLLAYAYAGYPLLLALWARVRPKPVNQAAVTPAVSLIVAAYNEEIVIADKVENSLKLRYPRQKLELIFVTDGSNDRTPDIVRRYEEQGVVLLHSPERRGKSAAINRAAALAQGEILVFSDANAFYLEDALEKLLRNFHDQDVGCASGRKTVRHSEAAISESEGAYWKYESFIKKQESRIHSTTGVVGEMIALRRPLFEAIPANVINDDAYLAFRIWQQGYRVIYEPAAVCWETSAVSTHDEIIRRRRINAGRYQLLFQPRLWPWNNLSVLFLLLSHKFMRLFLPFLMIGAFLSNASLLRFRATPKLLRLTFWAQFAFYLLAAAGYLAERRGRRLKLPAIAYYITSGNFTSLQGFGRYFSGKQTVLWEKAQRAAPADRGQ